MKITKMILKLTVLAFAVVLIIGAHNCGKASEYIAYTVRPGDTLWSISREFTPENRDLRYTIHEIQIVNEMSDSVLRVGQIISVPVYKEA